MAILNWNVSKEDHELIAAIAKRAKEIARRHGADHTWHEAVMDITAVHANGCPLRLAELLAADDFNFTHDAFGIAKNLDRETGRLKNCFLPRFSAIKETK